MMSEGNETDDDIELALAQTRAEATKAMEEVKKTATNSETSADPLDRLREEAARRRLRGDFDHTKQKAKKTDDARHRKPTHGRKRKSSFSDAKADSTQPGPQVKRPKAQRIDNIPKGGDNITVTALSQIQTTAKLERDGFDEGPLAIKTPAQAGESQAAVGLSARVAAIASAAAAQADMESEIKAKKAAQERAAQFKQRIDQVQNAVNNANLPLARQQAASTSATQKSEAKEKLSPVRLIDEISRMTDAVQKSDEKSRLLEADERNKKCRDEMLASRIQTSLSDIDKHKQLIERLRQKLAEYDNLTEASIIQEVTELKKQRANNKQELDRINLQLKEEDQARQEFKERLNASCQSLQDRF